MSTGIAEVTEISGVDLNGALPCQILIATLTGSLPCPREAVARVRMKCEHYTSIKFTCGFCLDSLKNGYVVQNSCRCVLKYNGDS